MEHKKISFFKDVYKSITDFEFYKEIRKRKTSKCFVYFFILILIYSVVGSIGITYSIREKMNQAKRFIQEDLNNFVYDNGILSINDDTYTSFYNEKIIVDTSGNNITDTKNAEVILEKEKIKFLVDNQYVSVPYKMFFEKNYNKENIINLLEFKKYIPIIVIASIFVMYITVGISTILDILVIALIGYIMSFIIGSKKISYKETINISIYAITLPVILAATYFIINSFTGFTIKYFSTMYTSIATIYVATAVILIKMEERNQS